MESDLLGDDFVEVRDHNIRLSYHVHNPLIHTEELLETIRQIMETLKTRLGLYPDGIDIEIFRTREEWIEHHTYINQEDVPSWVQGDSGRVIRLVTDDKKVPDGESLRVMVAHEVVHHVLGKAAGERYRPGSTRDWPFFCPRTSPANTVKP